MALFQKFETLDLDKDGFWTYQEARQLEAQFLEDTGRHVDMGEVYQNVFKQIKRYAHQQVLPCEIGDEVEAFHRKGTAEVGGQIGHWTTVKVLFINSDVSDDANTGVWVKGLEGEDTGKKWWQSKNSLRKTEQDSTLSCSVPTCINTDNGAMSMEHLACNDYKALDDICTAENYANTDGNGFKLREMCCLCGGGSTSVGLTGISHLPVNLSMQAVIDLTEYSHCLVNSTDIRNQEECIQNYTYLPEQVYQSQLQTFTNLCMLPDPGLCANLASKDLLPELGFTVEHAIPMFLKITGFASLEELRPQDFHDLHGSCYDVGLVLWLASLLCF